MTTRLKQPLATFALAAALAGGGLAVAAQPAAAQQDRGWRSEERGWNERDMDRWGRQQYERGYRLGRDEERRFGRGPGWGDADRWQRDQYERGYRLGRDEERRLGGPGFGQGYGRGPWRGEREGGWFSGGDRFSD